MRTLSSTLLSSVALMSLCSAALAVTATSGPIAKEEILDKNGIWLENDVVKISITENNYAGQVMDFIYKPTGQNLAAEKHPQGYCTDRMGEDRYYWTGKHSEGYSGRILSQSDDSAEAEVSYTWNYDHNDVQTTIDVSKTYRLDRGASVLYVTWALTNTGEKEAQMSPWVKHLGGRFEKLLSGPTLMLSEQGPYDPEGAFVKPVTDWIARLSGTENTEAYPMVCSIMDYAQIFQQFPWRGKMRFTLETILNRIHLKPGKTWKITYALAAMPNLGDVTYAAPELAASVEPRTGLEAGDETTLTVYVSPAVNLGERRIEGEILSLGGDLVEKLPNRQLALAPGKISSLSYAFTPPEDGVYVLSLTVFDDSQQVIRLGQAVNSQRSSITLPVVAGPTPDVVYKKWESGGFSWPRREERTVTPFRTLANTPGLKAGQVLVPERIFPEDVFEYPGENQPAYARVAKGEYESIQFAVEVPDGDVMALDLSVSPLTHAPENPPQPRPSKEGTPATPSEEREGSPPGRGGATEASDGVGLQAELREAFYLTTEVPSGYKNFPVGQWPDPLLSMGWQKKLNKGPAAINLDVKRKTHRRVFWLIVKAPRDAMAGVYKGHVAVTRNGTVLASLPVEVRVSDFALPKRATFRCSTGLVGFGAEKEWTTTMQSLGLPQADIDAVTGGERMLDRCRKHLLEYGWTPTMWGGLRFWQEYYDYGRGISVFSGASKPADVAWLKEKSLLEYAFVYAPFDEHADVEVPKVAEWCREWKAKSEVPILDCFYGSNVKPLFGLVDIWLGQSPAQDWARERKKKGDKFFACNSSLIWHVEFVPVTGRADFWNDFVVGYDGRYVYSTCRWTAENFTKNWTSGNWMGSVVYPGPEGVATSIRFETMRDGVEDYDYLAILRDRVAVAEKQGKSSDALVQAKTILTDDHLADKVKTVEDLHAMRNKIADLIETL